MRSNPPLSFGSGSTLRKRVDMLPKTRFKWDPVQIIPRSGTVKGPLFLYYRDPIAAVRSLLDRPELAEHITFTPQRIWLNKSIGKRRYSEMFTGDWAWETQVSGVNLESIHHSKHFIRRTYRMDQLLFPSCWGPIKHTSRPYLEIRVHGHYTSALATSILKFEISPALNAGCLSLIFQSQYSRIPLHYVQHSSIDSFNSVSASFLLLSR
jgi:hypothetical protein